MAISGTSIIFEVMRGKGLPKEGKRDDTEIQIKETWKAWKEQLKRKLRRSDLEGEFMAAERGVCVRTQSRT